ncbi:MAG: helix-hairpin-helix domain-containing protein [Oscillospiraceae bacterium]|nr:helix-hairpin-helix domain-containing protein [Oscillospiraceae bacterium]
MAIVFIFSEYGSDEAVVPTVAYSSADYSVDDLFYGNVDTTSSANSQAINDNIWIIDINDTDLETLMSIDGIDESTAEMILDYAAENGFSSVDELADIIGEEKLEEIRSFITANKSVSHSENSATTSVNPSITVTKSETSSDNFTDSIVYPIDLNNAAKEQLMTIKGIGEVIAERIIEYADNYGFSSVDDLLNVNGIGQATLEKIRPYVSVSGENLIQESESQYTTTTTAPLESTEQQTGLINLNTATKEELMTINGIGEVISERIIEYAQTIGFSSVDDLLNVKGIGEKTLEKIRPYVCV